MSSNNVHNSESYRTLHHNFSVELAEKYGLIKAVILSNFQLIEKCAHGIEHKFFPYFPVPEFYQALNELIADETITIEGWKNGK